MFTAIHARQKQPQEKNVKEDERRTTTLSSKQGFLNFFFLPRLCLSCSLSLPRCDGVRQGKNVDCRGSCEKRAKASLVMGKKLMADECESEGVVLWSY